MSAQKRLFLPDVYALIFRDYFILQKTQKLNLINNQI